MKRRTFVSQAFAVGATAGLTGNARATWQSRPNTTVLDWNRVLTGAIATKKFDPLTV